MATSILYREELKEYDFGVGHPFRGDRYEIFPKVLKKYVPQDGNYRIVVADACSEEDLRLICSQDYIDLQMPEPTYPLRVVIDLDGQPFAVYNVHLAWPGGKPRLPLPRQRTGAIVLIWKDWVWPAAQALTSTQGMEASCRSSSGLGSGAP